jgi:hypothetical protein
MSGFTTPLRVEYIDGRTWRVLEPFSYEIAAGGSITIGAGFETDFASVPRGLWNLFPPTGEYSKAAVIHDCLYRTHAVNGQPISRKCADDIFSEAMEVLHVGRLRRWLVYSAVRIGGARAWAKHNETEGV